MAKLACPCGEILSNVADPNDVEWVLIACRKLDGMDLSRSASGVVDRVYEYGFRVWRCTCGRLAVLGMVQPGVLLRVILEPR